MFVLAVTVSIAVSTRARSSSIKRSKPKEEGLTLEKRLQTFFVELSSEPTVDDSSLLKLLIPLNCRALTNDPLTINVTFMLPEC